MNRILDTQALLHMPLHDWHLIEANAGTGKTYTLANLYLRLILEGRLPEEILVVTFTRAATAELNERLQQRLQEALDALLEEHAADESLLALLHASQHLGQNTVRLRLQRAINRMDQAQITTIHGYCSQILRLLPLDSGQSPEFELEEEGLARMQAIRDWLRVHGMQVPAPDAELLRFIQQYRLHTPEALGRFLAPLLQPSAPQIHPSPGESRDALQQKLDMQLQRLQALWQREKDSLKKALREHKGLSRSKQNGLPTERIDQEWPRLDAWWANPGLPVPDWVESLCSEQALVCKLKPSARENPLQHPFCRQFDHFLAEARLFNHFCVQEIARWVRAREQQIKREQAVLDHDDLLARVDQALQDPQQGAELARKLRQQHPVAMIDEFQDTDAAQYRIFRAIHACAPKNDTPTMLVLIGDPKQSIYRFRGSDIHTYLEAARQIEPERRWQLSTNWRSSKSLVQGINQLFALHERSWVHANLTYQPSQVPDPPRARPLLLDGKPLPAIHCWPVQIKRRSDQQLAEQVAWRVAELIHLANQGRLHLGDRPLRANDIAVLVRKHDQATLVTEALRKRNLGVATQDKDNIWCSPEASDMGNLLDVLLQPENPTMLRNLLSSAFLGLNPREQWLWQADDTRWGDLLQAAHAASEQAQQQGFMAGFQTLFHALQPEQAIHRHSRPGRMLTNLQQLAELLQQDAHAGTRLSGLRQKLMERRQLSWRSAWEPRMDAQSDQVQLLTIHKAKGLQFPLVFAPWLQAGTEADKYLSLEWHHQGHPCWSLVGLASEEVRKQASRELLAEDIRLAYVALTRAETALWTAWGEMGREKYANQALTWLLLGKMGWKPAKGDTPAGVLAKYWPAATLEHPPEDPASRPVRAHSSPPGPPLQSHRFSRSLERQWRWHSFSSMTRNLSHAASRHPEPPDQPLPFPLCFPAGPNPGNLLHELLEHLEYQQPVEAQLPLLLPRLCLRYGLDPQTLPARELAQWLEQILDTPLETDGPSLRDIPADERLHEMPFKLACDRIHTGALKQAGLLPTWLEEPHWAGLLTGIIDLVHVWQGRWWIADFKSNLLGYQWQDYQPDRLQEAMQAHHYGLQYHIYALALHRHLQMRLPDYKPEHDFGGIRYLFLRGMRGREYPGSGVLQLQLSAKTLDWLNEQVFPWQVAGHEP